MKAKEAKDIRVMNTREYADLRGITVQAVSQAIKLGHKMPGVKSWHKDGRFYMLMVNVLEIPGITKAGPAD